MLLCCMLSFDFVFICRNYDHPTSKTCPASATIGRLYVCRHVHLWRPQSTTVAYISHRRSAGWAERFRRADRSGSTRCRRAWSDLTADSRALDSPCRNMCEKRGVYIYSAWGEGEVMVAGISLLYCTCWTAPRWTAMQLCADGPVENCGRCGSGRPRHGVSGSWCWRINR